MLNDLQPDLVRSASNHSIKSQGSSTGSIPAPTNSTIPRSSGLPTKQSGLRAPTSSSGVKPPGTVTPQIEENLSLNYLIGFDNESEEAGTFPFF